MDQNPHGLGGQKQNPRANSGIDLVAGRSKSRSKGPRKGAVASQARRNNKAQLGSGSIQTPKRRWVWVPAAKINGTTSGSLVLGWVRRGEPRVQL